MLHQNVIFGLISITRHLASTKQRREGEKTHLKKNKTYSLLTLEQVIDEHSLQSSKTYLPDLPECPNLLLLDDSLLAPMLLQMRSH